MFLMGYSRANMVQDICDYWHPGLSAKQEEVMHVEGHVDVTYRKLRSSITADDIKRYQQKHKLKRGLLNDSMDHGHRILLDAGDEEPAIKRTDDIDEGYKKGLVVDVLKHNKELAAQTLDWVQKLNPLNLYALECLITEARPELRVKKTAVSPLPKVLKEGTLSFSCMPHATRTVLYIEIAEGRIDLDLYARLRLRHQEEHGEKLSEADTCEILTSYAENYYSYLQERELCRNVILKMPYLYAELENGGGLTLAATAKVLEHSVIGDEGVCHQLYCPQVDKCYVHPDIRKQIVELYTGGDRLEEVWDVVLFDF
ncbi:ORF52 [Ranid herpesvirus 2]|uniref:ORF52 n=1 Tax=Ranid herpesvirus 2 TaxID=389214 RepID=Q14W54_9VIRU|nr:ORF52 [Ranid herpesvirus 2]ABG25642.1 ORF52 [Ranid herpesvirus 2]